MNDIYIEMGANYLRHLEFSVREEVNGTYTVIDVMTNKRIFYKGFPTMEDAEKFVINYPTCFEPPF